MHNTDAWRSSQNITTPVFGKHVVYDCPNEMLMEQKKFVKFGLSTENFRVYMHMIQEETFQMLQTDSNFKALNTPANEWGSFHCLNAMSELIILTASRTLQGAEVRSRLDKTFAQRYADLDGGFKPINLFFPNLPLPSYRKRDKAQKAMSEFYQEIIHARREGDHDHDHDMLSALSEQKYKDGRVLSDIEMAHIMIALLMAGQHTSSATSSWALLHLATRPDVQEQLYQEQVRVCRQKDGSLRLMEYEDIRDMPILDSVIRETLRMHPPIHSILVRFLSPTPQLPWCGLTDHPPTAQSKTRPPRPTVPCSSLKR
jgi:sterol 14alpha-demethylase